MRDLIGTLSGLACCVHFIQEKFLILVGSLVSFTQELIIQYTTEGIMHIIVQSLDDRLITSMTMMLAPQAPMKIQS